MSNNYSENSQHEIQPDREYPPNSDAVAAKLAIAQLAEEIHELSDEQSKAIVGGRSRYELSDRQLEAFAGGRVASVIHVIGFEN
ncbi:MAG: hypothetical protein HC941_32750 [Microcoleus sp. SU_5_3]|nr:hypothetical protein [Microcoleus sp. SU_5_3]